MAKLSDEELLRVANNAWYAVNADGNAQQSYHDQRMTAAAVAVYKATKQEIAEALRQAAIGAEEEGDRDGRDTLDTAAGELELQNARSPRHAER
jgi:hypothetical protein